MTSGFQFQNVQIHNLRPYIVIEDYLCMQSSMTVFKSIFTTCIVVLLHVVVILSSVLQLWIHITSAKII